MLRTPLSWPAWCWCNMAKYKEIELKIDAPVAWITLNRPDKANALSQAMITELRAALGELRETKEARVVLLEGRGKHFSSGHRLDELLDKSPEEYQGYFHNLGALMTAMNQTPQPLVALVQGVAAAGGTLLASGCDLVLAEQEASFCTPGVKVGVFSTLAAVPITRSIGAKRVMEMLLTARRVPASEALSWGMINQVVSVGGLREAGRDLARTLAKSSPLVTAIGKRAFYEQLDQCQAEAYRCCGQATLLNLQSSDAVEGINAFLEKRKPVWKGR